MTTLLNLQRDQFEDAYKRQFPTASNWVWRHFTFNETGYSHPVTDGMFQMYMRGRNHVTPIDMVLFCPRCGLQHLDKAIDANYIHASGATIIGSDEFGHIWSDGVRRTPWANPPHRSHLCEGCDYVWRPADVPTNGVQFVTTKGAKDTKVPMKLGKSGAKLDTIINHLNHAIKGTNGRIENVAVSSSLLTDCLRIMQLLKPSKKD